jgi:hypothetical protein
MTTTHAAVVDTTAAAANAAAATFAAATTSDVPADAPASTKQQIGQRMHARSEVSPSSVPTPLMYLPHS